MNFKINKKDFLESINTVSKAVSTNSPLPVLHNIKITAKDDYLQLTASDSDISIQSTIYKNDSNNLEIAEEGSILLDARYLGDMIRKIDDEKIELEVLDGSYTNITAASVKFELNGMRAEDYPTIDFSQPEEVFTIKAEVLKNIIFQTCFAASDKETKPVLTGLNMSCIYNKLTCVATDSYRLAQKIVDLDEDHNFNITVPSKSLTDIAKIINSDNDITIALDDKKVLFKIDDVLVQSRLIDGSYPETARLIPAEYQYELIIDARDILNALDRASFIKNDGVCIVRMEMKSDEISFTSRTNDAVLNEKLLPVSYSGAPLNISFKGNYVYDAIRALNAFQVKLCFTGSMKPFVLKNMEDDSIIQLVLPIKTYN